MIVRGVNGVTIVICLTVLLSCAEPDGGASVDSPGSGSAEPAYTINGTPVRLGDIRGDGAVSLQASVGGDLNDDGREDLAAVLVSNSDGSGVFYHLNVFTANGDGGWRFVGEELLGDRVRFDFLDIYGEGSVSSVTDVPIHPDDYGMLVAAYYTRSGEQSFADEPELYITKHWRVADGALVQIENY